MDIEGSVFRVTGASSGIGAATARLAAGHGARVVLVARRTERIEVLAAGLPDALAVTADVTDGEQVRAAVQAATERYGRLDVLVNNAGQGSHPKVRSTTQRRGRSLKPLTSSVRFTISSTIVSTIRCRCRPVVFFPMSTQVTHRHQRLEHRPHRVSKARRIT